MASEQILSTVTESADVQGYVYRSVFTGHTVVAGGNSYARDWYMARFGYRVVAKGYTPFGFVTSLK